MDIEVIKTRICDNYCKHFERIRETFEDIDVGQEELDRICEKCPLNELEVIPCAECFHYKPLAILEGGRICEVHNWQSKGDDFCSFAERRNE